MQTKGFFYALFIGFALLSLVGNFAYAQGPEANYPTIPGAPEISETTLLPEYILYLYYFAIAISGFIAFGALLYGGLRYLASGGSPSAKTAARGYIGGAILGIAVLLLSYIILTTINPQLAIFKLAKTSAGLPRQQVELANTEIPADQSIYQEVPLGTLIEAVFTQEKSQEFQDFLSQVEQLSAKVKEKANALRDELNNCSCAGLTPATCDVGSCTSNGFCTGEPCNRAAVEAKKLELKIALEALRSYVNSQLPKLTEYAGDISNLLYAALLMQEGVYPFPYEQFIELSQIDMDLGITTETVPFQVGGKIVRPQGNDPMNFYFDFATNKEIFEKLEGAEFAIDIQLPPPPGVPPPIVPGALTWPFPGGVITVGFGCQPGYPLHQDMCAQPNFGYHFGIDIADGTANNHPIYAAAAGDIIGIGTNPGCGYGNWLAIWHPSLNITTIYAHLKSVAGNIVVGASVNQGQLVGYENTTGFALGEHLHFEVITGKASVGGNCFGGNKVDPMGYF